MLKMFVYQNLCTHIWILYSTLLMGCLQNELISSQSRVATFIITLNPQLQKMSCEM